MEKKMIELIADKDKLLLIPNREAVLEMREETGSKNYRDWFPDNWGWDSIVWEVLEPYLCNGWQLVAPEDIGALTEATIISNGDYVWWDTDYTLKDFLEITLNEGRGYHFICAGTVDAVLPQDY